MIYKATMLIAEAFDKAGIKYGDAIVEISSCSYVVAGFNIDNGPTVMVRFISGNDNNDVALRVYGIIHLRDKSRRNALMKKINELNRKYRYFCFSCDDDNNVNMEYDFPLHTSDETVGQIAVDSFSLTMRVLAEVYPELMKVLWL